MTHGATLFDMIGMSYVRRFTQTAEFSWVTSGIVFAIGVHLSDANIELTRGTRQIGLMLLSWIAVLMTVILSLFLFALLFTGLEPLWATGAGTVILLNAGATMILLINAAFQDGTVNRPLMMRWAIRFSIAPLAIISCLAAYGLWLRINQYGLTPARIIAGIELIIVSVYAAGYAAAAIRRQDCLQFIRPVNIAAAILVTVLLSLLMTPVLSPARLSVADQLARLNIDVVEPDAFDFGYPR